MKKSRYNSLSCPISQKHGNGKCTQMELRSIDLIEFIVPSKTNKYNNKEFRYFKIISYPMPLGWNIGLHNICVHRFPFLFCE